ncbi:MAG: RdgB/HAM1 family non-canonical purine NTP pyrophosphatase [Oscillospiraceae bacterium]|nr:RdgB/HAM1 family non-canonical purine NTP pyrophosphatase [Oscillospiraceae bacterium]
MKLIIASNNAHKLVEIKAILGSRFEEILSLREAGIDHETVEDGETFLENAGKKAREIAAISGCCALADDSGLCVDALGGAPGIYSARYSGVHGDDKANNRKLLEVLRDVPDEARGAHFTCAIVLARPDGTEVSAEGYFYGVIAHGESGSNGFGYDPLFYLPEYGCTSAELAPEEKNRISHRSAALRLLVEKLGAAQPFDPAQ